MSEQTKDLMGLVAEYGVRCYDDDCAQKLYAQIRAALASLIAERDALRADAERLDWLERQDLDDVVFGFVKDTAHDGKYVINAGYGPFFGKTLRAAIDACISHKEPTAAGVAPSDGGQQG